MNHRLACLVAAGLALAADPHAVMSASVYYPTPNVEILVGGIAATTVPAPGTLVHRGPQGPRVRDSVAQSLRRSRRRRVLGRWPQHHRRAPDDRRRRTQMGARPVRDRHHQRLADQPDRGAALRIHDRGAIVRSGAWQDRQPWCDLRGVLQGARARGQPRHERLRTRDAGRRNEPQPAAPAPRRKRPRAPGRRASRNERTRSTPPLAWAAAPTMPSRRSGWTSKIRRRRR